MCRKFLLAGYNRVRIDAADVHAFISNCGLDKGTTIGIDCFEPSAGDYCLVGTNETWQPGGIQTSPPRDK